MLGVCGCTTEYFVGLRISFKIRIIIIMPKPRGI